MLKKNIRFTHYNTGSVYKYQTYRPRRCLIFERITIYCGRHHLMYKCILYGEILSYNILSTGNAINCQDASANIEIFYCINIKNAVPSVPTQLRVN